MLTPGSFYLFSERVVRRFSFVKGNWESFYMSLNRSGSCRLFNRSYAFASASCTGTAAFCPVKKNAAPAKNWLLRRVLRFEVSVDAVVPVGLNREPGIGTAFLRSRVSAQRSRGAGEAPGELAGRGSGKTNSLCLFLPCFLRFRRGLWGLEKTGFPLTVRPALCAAS